MIGATGDRLIRASMYVAVTAVAGFAAVVSYSHIHALGDNHGQDATAAALLPLSVDGLILAASLLMMHAARARRPAPPLARLALWLGIGATVAANIAYGVPYGLLGAAVSAWPACSFVIAVELLMLLIRGHTAPEPPRPDGPVSAPVTGAPAERAAFDTAPAPALDRGTDGVPRRTSTRTRGAVSEQFAEVHYATELAAGCVPSIRRIRRELHVGQDRAARIHHHLTGLAVSPNGNGRPAELELSGRPS